VVWIDIVLFGDEALVVFKLSIASCFLTLNFASSEVLCKGALLYLIGATLLQMFQILLLWQIY
jgi:hypothetical protein